MVPGVGTGKPFAPRQIANAARSTEEQAADRDSNKPATNFLH